MNPQIPVMNGEGRPRVIAELEDPVYETAEATTYTSVTLTEADGAGKTIIATTIVAGTALKLQVTGHGYVVGNWVRITGNTASTPDINGTHQVTAVVDADNFLIDVICTVSSDDGTVARIPAFDLRGLVINQRVTALFDAGDVDEPVYGKIIDVAASTLTVDEWVGGTPTNGKAASVDGWIADLPYCKKLTEVFTPSLLEHHLFRRRKETKMFGYEYKAVLDYSQLITADTLLLLKQHLSAQDGVRLVLIPRVDAPEYQYNVYLADPLEASIWFVALQGRGHRGIRFVFKGKETIPDLPMRTSGWGYGYGLNYGINGD